MLIYRLGGQFDAETFEGLDINLRQHDGGVNLAAAQFFELFQAICACLLVAAHMDSAIRTSSVWRRGLRLPRYSTFSFWIGSIAIGRSGAHRAEYCQVP